MFIVNVDEVIASSDVMIHRDVRPGYLHICDTPTNTDYCVIDIFNRILKL